MPTRIETRHVLVGLLFLALPLSLVVYKVHRVDYRLETLLPVETYVVTTRMSVVGHGDSIRVRSFLPRETSLLTLGDEQRVSDLPQYSERDLEGNRLAEWSGSEVSGPRTITVTYTAMARAATYEIDRQILIPGPADTPDNPYLRATPTIQANAPEIAALGEKLAPSGTCLLDGLRAIHAYCQELGTVSFKGTTDALTALRLGEASCNGKSRLFVALARHQGLPARLVGGLILSPGVKRTSHQWVEIQIGPYWVPFCPTNNHFASIPAHYLPLYQGDFVLFSHTADINFDYRFEIKRNLAIQAETMEQGQGDPLNLMSVWNTFQQAGISPQLLKVVLMIPLGTVVLVIFRNVIGFRTFGTFLPILIAVAARDIGLFWGLVVFVLLVTLVFCVRSAISRLGLLHLPQMAIMLTFVIIFMLTVAAVGVLAGDVNLAGVSMFPIAILAITAERFSLMIEEEGIWSTARVTVMTVITIAACYLVMNALTFQILFLSFPELILVVVFVNIWLGHWMGLRLVEYWRFRQIIKE